MSSELFVFVCIENRFSMYHNKCDHVFASISTISQGLPIRGGTDSNFRKMRYLRIIFAHCTCAATSFWMNFVPKFGHGAHLRRNFFLSKTKATLRNLAHCLSLSRWSL